MTTATDTLAFRRDVLQALGASQEETLELLRYNQNTFCQEKALRLPLPDEPFVDAWLAYADECETAGTIVPLEKYLMELRFPIKEGISQLSDYRAATRRGVDPGEASDACVRNLVAPEKIKIQVHSTPAGRIPLLIVEARDDFVTLVRALSRRNEPAAVSDSMGACIIGGYNNWGRIRARMRHFELSNHDAGENGIQTELQRIIKDKSSYQDRFIILSTGPYSGVPAKKVDMPNDEWSRLSLVIRREHECAHYFTRRVFGSMRNAVLDELIADFAGIVAAVNTFRADWFLLFVGLEDFPRYRRQARLENYRGTPPLREGAFLVLQRLVRDAAYNLERFAHGHAAVVQDPNLRPLLMTVLSCFTIEELASCAGNELVALKFSGLRREVGC
jgi:hypothetical protein